MSKEAKAVAVADQNAKLLTAKLEEEAVSAALRMWKCPVCEAQPGKAYDIDKKALPAEDHYAPRFVRCRIPCCSGRGKVVPSREKTAPPNPIA